MKRALLSAILSVGLFTSPALGYGTVEGWATGARSLRYRTADVVDVRGHGRWHRVTLRSHREPAHLQGVIDTEAGEAIEAQLALEGKEPPAEQAALTTLQSSRGGYFALHLHEATYEVQPVNGGKPCARTYLNVTNGQGIELFTHTVKRAVPHQDVVRILPGLECKELASAKEEISQAPAPAKQIPGLPFDEGSLGQGEESEPGVQIQKPCYTGYSEYNRETKRLEHIPPSCGAVEGTSTGRFFYAVSDPQAGEPAGWYGWTWGAAHFRVYTFGATGFVFWPLRHNRACASPSTLTPAPGTTTHVDLRCN